jgi:hypothetical protein
MSIPGLRPIDQALVPGAVRGGDAKAKSALETGLAFEQVLVGELSKQLLDSQGSDATTSVYSQLLPDALSGGIMGNGGLGVAAQLAAAIDPAIENETRPAR